MIIYWNISIKLSTKKYWKMMKVRIVKLPKCRHRPMMIEIHATVTGKVGIEASYYTESNGGGTVLNARPRHRIELRQPWNFNGWSAAIWLFFVPISGRVLKRVSWGAKPKWRHLINLKKLPSIRGGNYCNLSGFLWWPLAILDDHDGWVMSGGCWRFRWYPLLLVRWPELRQPGLALGGAT